MCYALYRMVSHDVLLKDKIVKLGSACSAMLPLLLLAVSASADPACYRVNSSWVEPQLLEAVTPVPGPAECQLLCQDTQNCTAWTWTSENNLDFVLYCFLLSGHGNRTSYPDSMSGPASCTCSNLAACRAGPDNSLASHPGIQREQQCQELCATTADCRFYTWWDDTADLTALLCVLLTGCEETDTQCRGCHTGTPDCSLEIDTKYSAILIVGGFHAKEISSVEAFVPSGSAYKLCRLPSLPISKHFHTLDRFVACGGKASTSTDCLTFSLGQWITSHHLQRSRSNHVSWASKDGIILIGGNGRSQTTEQLQEDGTTVPGFSLKYNAVRSCAIAEQDTNTVIITGGYNTETTVTRYTEYGVSKELPSLNEGRDNHACGSYLEISGTRVIIVTGGYYKTPISSTEVLVGSASTWTTVNPLPVALSGLRGVTANNIFYVTGGSTTGDIDGVTNVVYAWTGSEWKLTTYMMERRFYHAVASVNWNDIAQYCD